MDAARALAQVFHNHNVHLVYGGGTNGIMGEVARSLVKLSGPGAVHGIIPEALVRWEQKDAPENEHGMIDENIYGQMTIVPDMHTRKKLMARAVLNGGVGSGFVALSGGYGTLEELMEIVTWNQLGIHKSGICVYNVEGYWDGLLAWVKGAVKAGFVSEANSNIFVDVTTAEEVVTSLRDYRLAKGRFDAHWDKI